MKRLLYIATSDIHLKTFHIPYLEWLTSNGHSVDLAFEDRGGISFDMARHEYRIEFPRRFNALALKRAFSRLRHIISDGEYDIVHCHTPIPSALTRLAAGGLRKKRVKVLYTAHGFHFYKGGPLKNWLIYYPIELALSHFTDLIVTINSEDLAYTNNPLWGAASERIPGIGIQPRGFCKASVDERRVLRSYLGFGENDFILLYVAEFTPRKNHRFIIEAATDLGTHIPNLKILFLGRGELLEECQQLSARLDVEDKVYFMGFREDVDKFTKIADIGISASKHEGLGIALLEQMMCAIPVIACVDRGHREFVDNGKTGFLFSQNDRLEFLTQVRKLHDNKVLRRTMGNQAYRRAQDFTLSRSMEKMAEIYERFL